MAEIYKQISAPALGQHYGENVNETFENINDNFGVLANSQIVKGDAGTSLVSLNVPLSDLLDDSDFDCEGYSIPSQLVAFTEMFKEVKEGLGGTEVGDGDPDVTRAIKALKTSGRYILISFEEPAQGATVEILSSIPYVFVDAGVIQKIEESGTTEIYDLSGTISYKKVTAENNEIEYEWECQQNFPTLYVDDDGGIYWIIDGEKTQIPAQGPKGSDGKDGMMYVGLTNSTDFPQPADAMKKLSITHILDSLTGWESVSNYEDEHGIIPDSVPILIIPDKYTPNNQTDPDAAYIYFIGATYRDKTTELEELKGVVTANSQIYAKMNDITFKTSMQHIHNFENGSNIDTLKGYTISDAGSNGPGYMLFANETSGVKTLYLGRVNNIDSNSINNNLDTTNQYTFKIPGKVSVEEGNTTASGIKSHAEGESTTASGANSHAEGASTTASGQNSHAEGASTIAEADHSHTEGYQTQVLNNDNEPNNNKTYSQCSHTEGHKTTVCGNAQFSAAHAEGFSSNQVTQSVASGNTDNIINDWKDKSEDQKYTLATGKGAHAEGYNTLALGEAAHAEGKETIASGYASHAEGENTTASGTNSHAEGISTIASGNYSHVEGDGSSLESTFFVTGSANTNTYTASPFHILKIGQVVSYNGVFRKIVAVPSVTSFVVDDTLSSSDLSNVKIQIYNGISYGSYSHAEGTGTTASGNYSHAEGNGTIALGQNSHAEGNGTIASGVYSHAEGNGTSAFGDASHAEGVGTETTNRGEHAEGIYNKSSEDTISSVGIGNAEINRKNAIEVKETGDIYIDRIGGYNTSNTTPNTLQDVISDLENNSVWEVENGNSAYLKGNGCQISTNVYRSIAAGASSEVHVSDSFAFGKNCTAGIEQSSEPMFACGKYNAPGYITSTPSSQISYGIRATSEPGFDDPILFSIGCGEGDGTATASHRTNAFFVTKSGKIWALYSKGTDYTYYQPSAASSTCDQYRCLTNEL